MLPKPLRFVAVALCYLEIEGWSLCKEVAGRAFVKGFVGVDILQRGWHIFQ